MRFACPHCTDSMGIEKPSSFKDCQRVHNELGAIAEEMKSAALMIQTLKALGHDESNSSELFSEACRLLELRSADLEYHKLLQLTGPAFNEALKRAKLHTIDG